MLSKLSVLAPIFITPETNLRSFLFPGRIPRKVHPHHERPVEVKIKLTLLAIVDMEPQNEVIILNANILQVSIICTLDTRDEFSDNSLVFPKFELKSELP